MIAHPARTAPALAAALGLAAPLAVGTPRAYADPLDEIGFGAAASAMANARAAMATGAEAAHTNPAGLARITRTELLAGWQYSHERLELDGHDAGVVDAHGTSLGLAVPLSICGVRVATGVALYIPDQYLARIQLTPIGEPHFVRFATHTNRMVAEPVAAIAFGDFAVGAGASMLADARADQLDFDVGVIAGQKQGRADVDVSLPVRAAPLAGVWYRPSPLVELAATFRGELSLDVALDVVTNVNVPNVVTGDVNVALRLVSFFTPMRAAVAAAVHPRPDLAITVTPRLGAQWTTGAWRLRAGAAYLPSPVPPQTGITSFADGARTLATLGAGVRIAPNQILLQPIDIDVGIGWQHIQHDLVQKDTAMVPGGAFSSGGDVLQANLTSTVRF